ncbi:MAG: hypothetical protein R3Y13_03935 [bacterium]
MGKYRTPQKKKKGLTAKNKKHKNKSDKSRKYYSNEDVSNNNYSRSDLSTIKYQTSRNKLSKDLDFTNSIFFKGDYNQARNTLTSNVKKNSDFESKYYQTLADFDFYEYNFSDAAKLYEDIITLYNGDIKSFFNLSSINRTLSELDFAFEVLEKVFIKFLQHSEITKLYFTQIFIDKKEYERAFEILNTINYRTLAIKELNTFKFFLEFLLDKLNTTSTTLSDLELVNDYKFKIFQGNEGMFYSHLKKHMSKYSNLDNTFLEEINANYLVDTFNKQRNSILPIKILATDLYICKSSTPIAVFNNETSNYYVTLTNCDNNNPLTMYPINVSDQFDKEKIRIKK